ncbi:hypothetical protein [Ereboglobus luteus]|uniref:Uncharacterized protein n=1 Tax=Ereboglobus luteus TaxID=1796921 RepID=A0A2U8E252_9BACT|nr:hypothetical protein [Ereboglobus luteus]AWI08856.1 hypothetical protein CKA38_05955 [Ereboglobus luteus]
MNQAQTNARVGIFFVLGIALLWITFQALHTGSFNVKDGYEVTAPSNPSASSKSATKCAWPA